MSTRPHWTTYVAPACSALAAVAALATTLGLYFSNKEISRLTQRPFIVIRYKQTAPARPTRDENGMLGQLTMAGKVSVNNLGKTPAYNIEYRFTDQTYSCVKPSSFSLAPGEIKTFNILCMSIQGKAVSPARFVLVNLMGVIAFDDAYGQHYEEPAKIELRIGEPLNAPFFELNADPNGL